MGDVCDGFLVQQRQCYCCYTILISLWHVHLFPHELPHFRDWPRIWRIWSEQFIFRISQNTTKALTCLIVVDRQSIHITEAEELWEGGASGEQPCVREEPLAPNRARPAPPPVNGGAIAVWSKCVAQSQHRLSQQTGNGPVLWRNFLYEVMSFVAANPIPYSTTNTMKIVLLHVSIYTILEIQIGYWWVVLSDVRGILFRQPQ